MGNARGLSVNAIIPATRRPDWTVLVAVACVACSWFLMNSLTTDLGFLQFQFRFYNVLTLMHAPRSILTGPGGDGARLDASIFGTVCALAILAALAPLVSRRRIAWLGCVAPFVLMAIVGAILYHKLSQDLIADDGSYGDTGSQIIHFANSLAEKVGGVVTRQVHVGAGGYLALVATAVLAIKGLLGYQNSADTV
jgi:hypothetical protein